MRSGCFFYIKYEGKENLLKILLKSVEDED